MTVWWSQWQFWLIAAAWLPYTAFAVLYATRSPWYQSATGRSLLLSKVVISAVLTHALLARIFGAYPGHRLVFAVLIGGAVVAGWYMLANLLRLQRQRRNDPCPRRRVTD